ncbi:hypothetical protein FNF29_02213 [Cafeteria roenbergensis]|uniref:Uncharacterized protein n=1 Tax=Cafeteria roenbergensis TaxID=33653 RepID=A0A5A8CQH6_CAFRO|nr:hypothetical protein FNF29_02213 [Cafeteria roenbergensis]|eukprot:KAA0154684.1 hypothetical protein FNF29_02213 [Cafeteria roenbergensis]
MGLKTLLASATCLALASQGADASLRGDPRQQAVLDAASEMRFPILFKNNWEPRARGNKWRITNQNEDSRSTAPEMQTYFDTTCKAAYPSAAFQALLDQSHITLEKACHSADKHITVSVLGAQRGDGQPVGNCHLKCSDCTTVQPADPDHPTAAEAGCDAYWAALAVADDDDEEEQDSEAEEEQSQSGDGASDDVQ